MGLIGVAATFSFMWSFLRLNRCAARQLATEGDDGFFEIVLMQGIFAGLIALLFTGASGHSMLRGTWYVHAALGLETLRIYLSHKPSLDPSNWQKLLG